MKQNPKNPKIPELGRNIRQIIKTLTPGRGVILYAVTVAVALMVLSCPARAMVINVTYDSSVTSAANAAQIEAAYNLVAQNFETLYTNPITVNITVYWGGSAFGSSNFQLYGYYAYSDLISGLQAAETTPEDSTAVANLPASDPTAGNDWLVPTAEAKTMPSLGYNPNDPSSDGYIQFATSGWTFGPLNRAVPGEYDFIAVAEHETSEVLGRCFILDQHYGAYAPYDLFRFANGAQSLNAFDTGVYFSINKDVTPLKPFNAVTLSTIGSEDPQDWMPTNLVDSFDWELGPDAEGVLSSADLTALDILGYNLNFTPPKVTGTKLANGNFELNFTNVTGLGFTVWASTNILSSATNWVKLGTPTETAVGKYQFIDTTANKTRFYRVLLQ
ncbi:MAG TPA: NF038122 family metalloprotease [Candidatus Acidoferrales bacterium]|nr:NF038122 family metalloprotease [Candidatus Acidoferrales bacterium]